MKTLQKISLAVNTGLLGLYCLMPWPAHAANTVTFNTSDVGQTKSIAQWGVEVAWQNPDNMRQSIANMGADRIDLVAGNFYLDEPLQADGSLGPNSKASIDSQMQLLLMAGNKPYVLGPTVGNTNAYYFNGSALRTDRYAALIKATKQYINTTWNIPVAGVMPFNEPDFWTGQGTTGDLNTILTTLKNDPSFANTALIAGSTLNSNNAQAWYDPVIGIAGYGSTHVLGGSANSYANFFQHVTATGGIPSAPELHGLGEAIYAAQYGAQQGMWWGGTLRARGQFVKASDGKQLGYAENRANATAATVYRAPDGSARAFAGGFERFGASTPYRFVSTDRDVYFNGVGPIRQYMIQAGQGTDAYADIQYGANVMPPLDGNRWEIINRLTGQVLQVAGGSTSNGALVNSATDTGASNQRWDMARTPDGYYSINNANSGLPAEIFNASLSDGGSVDQWASNGGFQQSWYVDPAANGYYYIRNGNSNSYLTSNTSNAFQQGITGNLLQQWQFVLANPAPSGTLKAQYKFEGNANDSTGANNATAVGSPTYSIGPTAAEGQAISLNGTSQYVQLPSGVANSKDITVSTWVKWNGGNAFQRIFDFGNNTTSYMYLTPSSGDGTMRFAITTGGGTTEQILDTDPLPTGQWVHLALTLSGNTGVLYVNGAPTVAGQILLNPSDINSTLNYIGKSQYADPLFSGMIDDFRIYNYALNQAQVANLVPLAHYSWAAGVDNQWSTAVMASPKDWKLTFDNTATDYVNGDTVLFDDSATAFTVNTAANVSPLATTFYNTTTYTLTGAAGITGAGTLTKNGTGIVNINNVNTYTGATTINSGTLNLNGSLAGSAITVNGGTFAESATGSITGNVALTNNSITTLAGANSLGAIRATANGTLAISGGTTSTTTSGQVFVGDTPGDNAVLTVSAGVLNANKTSAPSLSVGSASSALGTMTISGGTVNAASEVWVSSTTGSSGTLNVSGSGTLNIGSWLAIGRGGDNGNLNVTGGNLNVNSANLSVASFGGNVGRVAVTGGTITTVNSFYDGEGGNGTLTLSGSGNVVVNGSEGIRVGRNAGSVGLVNLNTGGTITTTAATGGGGASTFNFNGGTLKANASNASFFTGLGVANVYGAGAVIDDGGNNITIAQALKAPSGSGITSVALTSTGLGYTSAPLVTISGGTLASGGVGATAVANFVAGQVTAVTITNPGNYTSTTGLTVSFSGNAARTPTVGSIATATNSSGGLTKQGSGTVTLTAANTYTGATNVNAGVLTIDTAASMAGINYAIAASATLNVNGAVPNTANFTSTGTVSFPGNVSTSTNGARDVGNVVVNPAGLVTILPSAVAGHPMVLTAAGLSCGSATAKFDLTNNELIVTDNLSNVRTEIITGSLKTSTAGLVVGSLDLANGKIEARATLLGDTDLNGTVDVADLGSLATSYGISSGATWALGDSNYDNAVDVSDLGALATNYGASLATGPAAEATAVTSSLDAVSQTAVPEPTATGLIGITMIATIARRRRQAARSCGVRANRT